MFESERYLSEAEVRAAIEDSGFRMESVSLGHGGQWRMVIVRHNPACPDRPVLGVEGLGPSMEEAFVDCLESWAEWRGAAEAQSVQVATVAACKERAAG